MALNYASLIAYIDGLYADGSLSEQDYNAIIVYILANGDIENAPRDLIQFRRGNEADLPVLAQGEAAFTLDTEYFFTGGLNGNVKFGKKTAFANVLDFGAKGDDSSDSGAAFVAAIASVSTADRAIVYAPKGSYLTSVKLTLPRSVILIGDGEQTKLKPYSALNEIVEITGGFSGVRDIAFENPNTYATYAINCIKSEANVPIAIKDCVFNGFTHGVHWSDSDRPFIDGNTFLNCTWAINSVNDFRNGNVSNNYVLGGSGIYLGRATQQAEGVNIVNNHFLPAVAGSQTFCIKAVGGLQISVKNCIFDQVFNGTAFEIENGSSYVIDACWFGAGSATPADYGLFLFNTCYNFSISNCTFSNFAESAIYLNTGHDINIDKCYFLDTSPSLRDVNVNDIQHLHVLNCLLSGTAGVTEDATSTGRIDWCRFVGGVPTYTYLTLGDVMP